MRQLSMLLLFIALLLAGSGCNQSSVQEAENYSFKNTNDYEKEWSEIEALETKGMGQTIRERIDSLLNKAVKEENVNQIFKALAYQAKYTNRIEEESSFKIISSFEKHLETADFPLKQLLHSATAELYLQYYQQNRWRFHQRSNRTEAKSTDLRVWSLDQILEAIRNHYLQSLSEKEKLITLPTASFLPILNKLDSSSANEPSGLDLRPSLYDFLSDRALSYFKTNEGRTRQPINSFHPNQFNFLNTAENFLKISLPAIDTISNSYLTAKVYQELIRAHIDDNSKSVFLDFELERLRHYYTSSNQEQKDSLFENQLTKLSKTYPTAPLKDEIDYQIAQLYFQLGSKYDLSSSETEYRWHLKKAHELCASKKNKNTLGAKKCQQLLETIEFSSLGFQLEKVYLPNKPILFRVDYKNQKKLHFRLVKAPFEENPFFGNRNQRELLREVIEKKIIREWSEVLKDEEDFQQHSTELYTQGLKKGNYFMLCADNEDFNFSGMIAFANFSVSELAFFSRRINSENAFEIFSLDRSSGKAIPKTKISVFRSDYDYSINSKDFKKIGDYFTNSEGHLKFKSNERSNSVQFFLSTESDSLSSGFSYYLHQQNAQKAKQLRTHLFTDRAIYRAGQTVYFKGIIIESDQDRKTVKKNHLTSISLFNVNGEKLKSVDVQTNDYGSYNGSFIIPSSGLNGKYRIQDKHGTHYFSVEEYKRPTFKIELDSSNRESKINEKIVVSGKVTAYSGASLPNSKVSYHVIRKSSYPFWPMFSSFFPPTNEKEIANGTIESDSKGNFSFDFLAQADANAKNSWNPIFNFSVSIDATAPNGESQQFSKNIRLSSQSIFLSTNLTPNTSVEKLKKLVVYAKNAEGVKVDQPLEFSLWKLKTPTKPKKKKLWAKTDQQLIPEEKKSKLFPDYPEEKQASINSFPRDFELLKTKIISNESNNLFNELKAGAYEIEIKTKDNFGNEVAFKERFVVFDQRSKLPPYPLFSWLNPIKKKAEVGEEASFLFASSLRGLRLLYEIEVDGKIVEHKWLNLNNEQRLITIPIKESFRGNFSVHFTGVHSDRLIRYSETVAVPFSNKKLAVELSTFRNKVKPGSSEKWTLSIDGESEERVNAEILASMYDQSLDQFIEVDWSLDLYDSKTSKLQWDFNSTFQSLSAQTFMDRKIANKSIPNRVYPTLNWFGFSMGYNGYFQREMPMTMSAKSVDEILVVEETESLNAKDILSDASNSRKQQKKLENKKPNASQPIRSDFRETAFFYPELKTDSSGKVFFEFEMPDALTQWKFRALAHNPDLKVGKTEKSIVSQKELMVVPNVPRFFRAEDELQFTALVNNLSDKNLSGSVKLEFYNLASGKKVDLFTSNSANQKFTALSKNNATVSWSIKIPKDIAAIQYKIVATSKDFSDGEEKAIAVLPNRMLVTESMALEIRSKKEKTYFFSKLIQSAKDQTLLHKSYTIEFTSNPAWYAIQALPNLAESENESAESIFNQLYANSLAENIVNSQPKIKAIFDQWKMLDTESLTSKLFQNQELKSIIINETPWLNEAKTESEQKRRIGLLFDLNQMTKQKENAINKLLELQLSNGGWSWFKGMRANRYISQYILEGLGHMQKLGIKLENEVKLLQITRNAIRYCDEEIKRDYERLQRNQTALSQRNISQLQIQYLYARSFFPSIELPKNQKAFNYYFKQAEMYWLEQNNYQKGMIGLSFLQFDENLDLAKTIKNNLKDNALNKETLGMYWKTNNQGYYWYQAPVETQSLLIEFFAAFENEKKAVEEMKIWLLKQKQTQAWSNSKATASACYALLLMGSNLLETETKAIISLPAETIQLSEERTEAGSGYFKKKWTGAAVNSDLGRITINNQNESIAWGAAYWQYEQDLDKITSSEDGSLALKKEIFKKVISEKGTTISPIENSALSVGDLVSIRIELKVDRTMEFIHLQDMRAAAFEPISTLSGYKFQDGLGYYQNNKDASTNFFFDRITKGTYVFEYDLRVSQRGQFSNGISSIQCLYAPEFSAHSDGKRVKVN